MKVASTSLIRLRCMLQEGGWESDIMIYECNNHTTAHVGAAFSSIWTCFITGLKSYWGTLLRRNVGGMSLFLSPSLSLFLSIPVHDVCVWGGACWKCVEHAYTYTNPSSPISMLSTASIDLTSSSIVVKQQSCTLLEYFLLNKLFYTKPSYRLN